MYFLIYVTCALYLWALGVAVFGGCAMRRSLYHVPWLGYAALIGCLQLLHLFAPLNAKVSWIFLVTSSLGAVVVTVIRLRKESRPSEDRLKFSLPLQLFLLLGVSFFLFFPAFNTTTQAIVHYDVGYYYLQTIRWITTFPIVPGLGNLFLNLAFNQSPFLIASLFDSLGAHLWGYSLLGGVLPWMGLTLSIFALLQGACSVLSLREPLRPIEKAYLVSSPAWIYTLLTANISSNSPDIPSACLQIHLFLCFASLLAARDEQSLRAAFAILLILAALSLSVKLNAVFLVATVMALGLAVLLYRGGPQAILSKPMILAIVLAVAIFLPWVWRGVVTSGYPFFPSTALAMPVSWKIPRGIVAHFYDITVYWGRQPYYDLEKVRTGFAWVPEWLQRNWKLKDQFQVPFLLTAVWTSLLVLLAWRRKNLRSTLATLFLMLAPVVVSLAMWFLTAPDPRYLGSITWLLPLAVPLCLISHTSPVALVFLGLSLCVNYAALGSLRYNTEWAWKRRAPGFPEIRTPEMQEGDNAYGVRFYYPRKGDQPFDAPLPSTRERQPSLKFLDEGQGISGGFRDARIDERGRQIDRDRDQGTN